MPRQFLSSFLSRLSSSSFSSYSKFVQFAPRKDIFSKSPNFSNHKFQSKQRLLDSWRFTIVPFAIAASAGYLALESLRDPSLCDSDIDARGKGNARKLVKGSHKIIPPDCIEELRAVFQDNMTLDYEERYFHGTPQNSYHKAVNVPDVVVYPR